LGRFVRRFQDGEIPAGGVFIAEAFDRITREPVRKAAQLFLTLINDGLDVHLTVMNKTFTAASLDQNIGDLYLAIGMMIGAHAESHNKSGRERDAWKLRRGNQMNIIPAWFIKRANGQVVNGFKGCRAAAK
jgi:DNA invertase Pin-like site-specific DNA recombinase